MSTTKNTYPDLNRFERKDQESPQANAVSYFDITWTDRVAELTSDF
jgi:hypothetical protein